MLLRRFRLLLLLLKPINYDLRFFLRSVSTPCVVAARLTVFIHLLNVFRQSSHILHFEIRQSVLNLEAFFASPVLFGHAGELDQTPLDQVDAKDKHEQASNRRKRNHHLADRFLVPRRLGARTTLLNAVEVKILLSLLVNKLLYIGVVVPASMEVLHFSLQGLLIDGHARMRKRLAISCVLCFICDHQRVGAAIGSGYTDLFLVDVEDEVVLPHKCASKHDLVIVASIGSQAVLGAVLVEVEVLGRKPVDAADVAVDLLHMDVDDWVAHHPLLYVISVLFLVEFKTGNLLALGAEAVKEFSRAIFSRLAALVVKLVGGLAEIVEVEKQAVVELGRQVAEGCA